VKSKPGRGTVFTITLPKGETARKVASDLKRSGTDRSHRILVLDDDPEILGILRDMIRLKGHKVTAIDDGKKALELIQEQDFDLVLTDLGMPEISGWEIAREVKSKNPQVPVILITGWGTQYEDEDLSDRGVDLVLSKPFSWERLLDAIGKMLSLS
jgi:DNA-binding response OmpR family regulator